LDDLVPRHKRAFDAMQVVHLHFSTSCLAVADDGANDEEEVGAATVWIAEDDDEEEEEEEEDQSSLISNIRSASFIRRCDSST
jgi:hypothetical protein